MRLESTKHLAAALPTLTSSRSVVFFGKRVVLGLALAHGLLKISHPLLGGQAARLPVLAVALAVGGQLKQVLAHLVQRGSKLDAVLSHSVVDVHHLVVGLGKAALAVVGAAHVVLCSTAQLLEALGVVIFEASALLEKLGKFLQRGVVSTRLHNWCSDGSFGLTLAEAMLCFSLPSKALMPTCIIVVSISSPSLNLRLFSPLRPGPHQRSYPEQLRLALAVQQQQQPHP